jgi:signal transduction histidine kinase
MQERVERAGGTPQVDSRPQRGTQVQARFLISTRIGELSVFNPRPCGRS